MIIYLSCFAIASDLLLLLLLLIRSFLFSRSYFVDVDSCNEDISCEIWKRTEMRRTKKTREEEEEDREKGNSNSSTRCWWRQRNDIHRLIERETTDRRKRWASEQKWLNIWPSFCFQCTLTETHIHRQLIDWQTWKNKLILFKFLTWTFLPIQ